MKAGTECRTCRGQVLVFREPETPKCVQCGRAKEPAVETPATLLGHRVRRGWDTSGVSSLEAGVIMRKMWGGEHLTLAPRRG